MAWITKPKEHPKAVKDAQKRPKAENTYPAWASAVAFALLVGGVGVFAFAS